MSEMIAVGADAPDFTLKSDSGEEFKLSDLRGFVRAMLVFYPKDFTPGCTDQLIHIRKNIAHLRGDGIEPMGVNPDDAESHRRFKEEHGLNFDLLVDEGSEVATAYGALKAEGNGIERTVIVVGKNGKIVFAERGAPPWQRVLSEVKKVDDSI